MNEEVQFIIDATKERMDGALAHLENELAVLRAGKANPRMLDNIHVDYYGSSTPLTQVANIGTPDPKTIAIQPWEKSLIGEIEKAIMAANIGLTPVNNGEIIRLNVPALTEERRRSLVKQVHGEGESARVSLRTARRDANEEIKKMSKDGLPEDDAKKAEDMIQKMTDSFSEKIEKVVKAKEEDIMKV